MDDENIGVPAGWGVRRLAGLYLAVSLFVIRNANCFRGNVTSTRKVGTGANENGAVLFWFFLSVDREEGLALEVEGDVGVTLAEVVKRVASIISAVGLGRIRDLEREQIRILSGRLA